MYTDTPSSSVTGTSSPSQTGSASVSSTGTPSGSITPSSSSSIFIQPIQKGIDLRFLYYTTPIAAFLVYFAIMMRCRRRIN